MRFSAPSKISGAEAVEPAPHGENAGAQAVDGLLVVRVLGRFLAGQARRGELRVVAAQLHLPDERVLVGGETKCKECVRVERLLLRVLGRLDEPGVELPEHLVHLTNRFVDHGTLYRDSLYETREPSSNTGRRIAGLWSQGFRRVSRRGHVAALGPAMRFFP